MSDDAITPGAPAEDGEGAPRAIEADDFLADLPAIGEGSDLVRLTYDEWNGLCADLERWLATRFRPRE